MRPLNVSRGCRGRWHVNPRMEQTLFNVTLSPKLIKSINSNSLCLFGMLSPAHLFRLFSFYRCAFQLVAQNSTKNDMAWVHSLHSAKPRATASLFTDWTSMSPFSKLNLIICQQNPLNKLWLEFCWTPQIEYIRVDTRGDVPGHSWSRHSPRLVSIANASSVYLDSIFTHMSVSSGLPLTTQQLSCVLLLLPAPRTWQTP